MPSPTGVLSALAWLSARFDNASRRLSFRLAVFAALSLAIAWPLLSTAPMMNFFRDAQVLMPYEHTAVRTVLDYLQVPLWDPYYCGGVYSLGTPQSRFVSPTFFLSLLFGPLRAESVTVFVMLVVGLEGAWRYSVSRGATAAAALLAAPVFAASGLFAAAPPLGWINFFGFELIPWALVGARGAVRGSPRGAVTGGVALAWIVGFGGTYAAPMSALFCAFEVLEGLVDQLRRRRSIAVGLFGASLCVLIALGLSLVRLWPVAESLADAPRVIADAPGFTWTQVREALAGHLEDRGASGTRWVQGLFMVGIAAVPAALVGMTRWRALPVLLIGGVSAWLATGYAYSYGLFPLLRRLPVFSVLRYPERYLVFVALAVGVLAAFGISRTEAWARRRPVWHVASLTLAALLFANAIAQVKFHHKLAAPRELVPPPAAVDQPFHQARGTRWALGYYAPMQRGSLSCWDAYPIPQSPLLRSDLQQEESLVDPSAGTIERVSWSPNRIDLRAKLDKPGRVRINQNWHAGWRSNVGQVVSDDGLLAVELPAGVHDVAVRFLPRSAVGGGLASLVAALLCVWIWRRRSASGGTHRVWLVTLAAATVPFAVSLVVRVAMAESHASRRPLLGLTGDSILAEQVPSGAKPLDVRFANNVTLTASLVSPSRVVAPGATTTIELDWTVTGVVPRGAGVFVHVQPAEGGFINRDHNLISSTLDLSDAPQGKVLRDIVVVAIPPTAKPGTWSVWVGLWMARGNGARVPIVSNGAAEIVEGRIRAATFEVR